MNTKRTYWTPEEINLLTTHSAKTSFAEMQKLYFPNRTAISLQKRAIKLGLASGYRKKTHSHDVNYWKSNSLETAYHAGIFAADGCLNLKNYVFRWMISGKDRCLLDNFKKVSNYTGEVKIQNRTKYQSKDSMEIADIQIAGCQEWYKDLKEIWNITPQKTFTLQPPNIKNKNQILAFIIGFIDGDGHISARRNTKNLRIGVVNSSLDILEWIKRHLDICFPILTGSYKGAFRIEATIKQASNKNYYTYCIQGIRASIIFDYLSKFDVPKLKRKWEKEEVLSIVAAHKAKYPELFRKRP